jgi:hypothetical protein
VNETLYKRAMLDIEGGDLRMWDDALRHAKRTDKRQEQLRLLRLYANATGLLPTVRTAVPTARVEWMRVRLCWSSEIARHFCLDMAEHVDRTGRLSEHSSAVRAYLRGELSVDEMENVNLWLLQAARTFEPGPEQAAWALYYATLPTPAWVRCAKRAQRAVSKADAIMGPDADMKEEANWQKRRLAEYLLGEVIPCWDVG